MTVTPAVYDSSQEAFRPRAAGSDPPLAAPDYVHDQASPSQDWVIVHSLNTKNLEILIFNAAGVRVYADPDYAGASQSSIAVHFSVPLAGRAYVRSL